MVAAFGLNYLAWLLIWGGILRLIEYTFRGTWISQALGVIY